MRVTPDGTVIVRSDENVSPDWIVSSTNNGPVEAKVGMRRNSLPSPFPIGIIAEKSIPVLLTFSKAKLYPPSTSKKHQFFGPATVMPTCILL